MTEQAQKISRSRRLEWITVLWWLILGASGFYWIPRLKPLYTGFGSELPLITQLWLGARPIFALAFIGALVMAAFLLATKFKDHESGGLRRRLFQAALLAAALVTLLSPYAAVAPQFACCSLEE